MAKHLAGLRQEFATGQKKRGFCGPPGVVGFTAFSGHPSKWEAQRHCGMEKPGRDVLDIDIGNVERR